ncbi:endonuclease/exonuclease/phosphatase [Bacillaceae bacterium SIJ1]|uniref:endonuclease/exonuclease/phosphatase family protein n=1 Tax=Litoribacterium kuwaitense TaxID=1398745 RepID=UPI0013E99FA3|nr:endonuclease/exonuclease/phosphatase family protein [Litoribacterium kuwaitense]NGP45577.1 endonuclease/exonuclease/phosphatase [Litoribacterium kuwaitense]
MKKSNWSRIMSVVSLSLVLLLCFAGVNQVSAKGGPPHVPKGKILNVKVMSYNVHHAVGEDGVLDMDRIADVIRQSGAEIIGLQEVDRHWSERSDFVDQAKALADALGMHYVFGANLDFDPLAEGDERRQYGTAILSTYPILDSENVLLNSNGEQRGLLRTKINIRGEHIQFYNTHLGLSTEERERQTAEIMQTSQTFSGPSIIVGDFNAEPDDVELDNITAEYEDAFADNNEAYTYSAANPTTRIDYIFHSDELNLQGAEVIDTLASDHLPIVAEFEWKRKHPHAK